MPRRRAIKILLFPIVAPILLIGYALYVVGDSKARVTRQTTAPIAKLKQSARPDNVEIGLMQELTESPSIS